MKVSHITAFSLLLLGGFAAGAGSTPALAEQVSREQDIVNLRLGQRIQVDDGTCPAGQIKEVSGAKMTAGGILAGAPVFRDPAPRNDRGARRSPDLTPARILASRTELGCTASAFTARAPLGGLH